MSATTPALETRNLVVRFGGLVAVNDVSFKLRKGEIRCLIGPNGAGKSTFFHVVTGQLRPHRGEVLVDGVPVSGLPPYAISSLGVGIKTQTPNLFDALSVEENLLLSARARSGPARARRFASEALERMRLGDIRLRKAGQLSHGERQRVELAMVASAAPSLVLLDEPAAGTTRKEARAMAKFIRSLGTTCAVAIVEHDMQFVRMVCEHVSVFHEGRILKEGATEEIFRDPEVREIYFGEKHQ